MVVCVVIYLFLLAAMWVEKRKRWIPGLKEKEKRLLFHTLFISNTLALALFSANLFRELSPKDMRRNSYGEGSHVESYEVTVEGELENEPVEIQVQEREYTSAEIQGIFAEMIEKLDEVILGENENRDRVEKDLNLVEHLEGYPVDIRWEADNYEVLDAEGRIYTENTKEEGTIVELRGTLSYGENEATYVTHVAIYPETKTGKEKWLDVIQKSVADVEEKTRQEETFSLPETVLGQKVEWRKEKDNKGYLVLLFGFLIGCVLLWKGRQDEKEKHQKMRGQMLRDYPDIVSKFTLLLGAGMTVKNTWLKIVQGYEEGKAQFGERAIYEEMKVTCNEIQGGISEAEAYERFGKRCQVAQYMKFGALLSQNLKKGGKGLSELLKLESIQAFENQKSEAKRMGEEAGTKLLAPMFGMFAVVMLMVIVPAFLSIQI